MFDSVKNITAFPVRTYKILRETFYSLGIIGGGISITTIDHADIRGLGTA